ncbi:Hypothetical predicted protein [Podarcis lilfordi]|uniref:Uncharacterized protein n=1 Tax=Podarcis lilfordi TaxID=74358 RepID=A0AA35KH99_9SAUR|nr:Hypothetical predicted protein [Podarcis lilfordi]
MEATLCAGNARLRAFPSRTTNAALPSRLSQIKRARPRLISSDNRRQANERTATESQPPVETVELGIANIQSNQSCSARPPRPARSHANRNKGETGARIRRKWPMNAWATRAVTEGEIKTTDRIFVQPNPSSCS